VAELPHGVVRGSGDRPVPRALQRELRITPPTGYLNGNCTAAPRCDCGPDHYPQVGFGPPMRPPAT
jgi:hypothetical protein